MQTMFLEGSITIEHAREYGHTHLFEVRIGFIVHFITQITWINGIALEVMTKWTETS